MKVCFITGEYPPMLGGVADHTAILVSFLERLGVDCSVITSARAVPQGSDRVFPRVRKWGFGSWPTVRRLVAQVGPDIVHVQYQRGAFDLHPSVNFLPFWLRRLGYRVITTLHDLKEPYLFPKAGRLRRLAVAAVIRSSNASILTNEEDLAEAKRLAPDSQLSLIPLGSHVMPELPPDFSRESLRAELGVKPGDWLLCYFGLLTGSKGVEYLLEALRLLVANGLPAKLLIMGGGLRDDLQASNAYQQQILALCEQPELKEAVIWAGYVSQDRVSALFSASDICVLPFTDGASFRRSSLISAVAHKIPVVTTMPARRQERRPRLVDRENVMLVDPESAGSLAGAIRHLIESPELVEHLKEGAMALSQEFSWDEIARQTADLYERVCMSGEKICVPAC